MNKHVVSRDSPLKIHTSHIKRFTPDLTGCMIQSYPSHSLSFLSSLYLPSDQGPENIILFEIWTFLIKFSNITIAQNKSTWKLWTRWREIGRGRVSVYPTHMLSILDPFIDSVHSFVQIWKFINNCTENTSYEKLMVENHQKNWNLKRLFKFHYHNQKKFFDASRLTKHNFLRLVIQIWWIESQAW